MKNSITHIRALRSDYDFIKEYAVLHNLKISDVISIMVESLRKIRESEMESEHYKTLPVDDLGDERFKLLMSKFKTMLEKENDRLVGFLKVQDKIMIDTYNHVTYHLKHPNDPWGKVEHPMAKQYRSMHDVLRDLLRKEFNVETDEQLSALILKRLFHHRKEEYFISRQNILASKTS